MVRGRRRVPPVKEAVMSPKQEWVDPLERLVRDHEDVSEYVEDLGEALKILYDKQSWDRIRVGYRIQGSDVMLFWSRPLREDSMDWIETTLAKFRYDPRKGDWVLFWADNDNRCHRYRGFRASKKLDDLLREVDDDPTGIFWG